MGNLKKSSFIQRDARESSEEPVSRTVCAMTFISEWRGLHMASNDPASSEASLDEALECSPEFGIRYLNGDTELREHVFRYIKRWGRGFFRYEDLEDLFQLTLYAIYMRAKKPEFCPRKTLRMVLTIARNKSIDLLRKRGHRIKIDEDAILEAVAVDTKGSEMLMRWQLHVSHAEAKELREILIKFIPTLPERQRIVAQCFVDNFEEFRKRKTYEPLAAAVSAITKITECVADVKNDWRYAREKIIAELQGRGYTFITLE
jgi:DNA-directed RNA polymerase specialized sigma24 family protein